ncbi:unnamed protein product [Echinostoma caproni]|uniref:Endo/exonuclease/phosphatase domain-containing protein n=1 Tax=Echinostoma caproni TaxID=27848 RepID=A0A183AF53_9TREM|nr:unnamed protein product [Echinostoma caproni]
MVADQERGGRNTTSYPGGFLHRQYLNCFCSIAQGLLGKFPEVNLRFISSQWDIIVVIETWLTADISDSELSLSEMSLLRSDRPTRGGGVLLYYRNSLDYEQIYPPVSTPDTLWCRLKLSKHDDCLIGVVYRPPSSSETANETLSLTMSHILTQKFTHVLLMGDFSCPYLNQSATVCSFFEHQFKRLIDSLPLYNHMKVATRFVNLQLPSILDLVLTNEELMVQSVNVTPPLNAAIMQYLHSNMFVTLRFNEVPQATRADL